MLFYLVIYSEILFTTKFIMKDEKGRFVNSIAALSSTDSEDDD